MRAAPLVLLLLVAVPVADAAWSWITYREATAPAWYADSFQLGPNATRIWVAFDVVSAGELTGHMIALYDDSDNLLRGTTIFSEGGQIVEATLATGDTRVTNEEVEQTSDEGYFQSGFIWNCDATCNPSRKFKAVIATGGELLGWRYSILTNAGGNAKLGNTSGPDAWAYTTREFDGDVIHVQTPVRGVHKVTAGSTSLHADGRALATFVKPDPSPDPQVMDVVGAVDMACPCFAGDWPAGDYTFRYQDQDINGVEGLFAFADVQLP